MEYVLLHTEGICMYTNTILQLHRGNMKMKRKKLIGLVSVAILAFGLFAAGCSGKEGLSESGSDQIGNGRTEGGETESRQSGGGKSESGQGAGMQSMLSSFEAVTLDGGSFTQEDLAAKDVTLINFWALTCPPCIREMPEIARFAASLPDNIQVVTVCLDGGTDEEHTKSILDEAGFDGVTLLTGSGDLRDVIFEIQYTPTTILVDKDGKLVGDVIIGGQEDLAGTYTDAVNRALKQMGKAEIANAEG